MYLELKNINKSFGDYKASDNVSFGVEKGKLCALLGSSGSGKTTILRMIAGLEFADSGDIFIDGSCVNNIPASKRGIGFVFQSYALFRYMTVFDNIAFGLTVQKKSKSEIKHRVTELIDLIGLTGLEKRYPSELSGGQRQRVAFARALAPNPKLLLLDEPFSAIDAKVRKELRTWLRNMISQVGITSIFVTHDQDEAMEVADDIIITNQGRVEQVGSPFEIYTSPQTPFVAQFIGQSDIIKHSENLKGFEQKGNNQAIIRPEDVDIYKKGSLNRYMSVAETGIVKEVSFRGSYTELTVNINDILIRATYPINRAVLSVGEEVSVLIHRLYVFEDNRTYLLENSELQDKNLFYI